VLVTREFLEGRWAVAKAGRVNDSKQLTAAERDELWGEFESLMAQGQIHAHFGVADVAEIEALNILGATKLAMRRALEGIYRADAFAQKTEPDLFASAEELATFQPTVSCRVLVDGLALRHFPYPHTGIVKGDARSLCIAMASIIAKVTRDRMMNELDGKHPGYGFAQHKGYGTEEHREAVLRHGRCPSIARCSCASSWPAGLTRTRWIFWRARADAPLTGGTGSSTTSRDGRQKNSSLDRVLGRLDALDSVNLANLVQRLARERGLFEEIFNTLQEGVLVITPEEDRICERRRPPAHRLRGRRTRGPDPLALRAGPPAVSGRGDRRGGVHGAPGGRARVRAARTRSRAACRLYMVPFRGIGRSAPRRFAVIVTDVTREKRSTEQRIEDERTSSVLLLAAGSPTNWATR
jgi:ribonuclease HII